MVLLEILCRNALLTTTSIISPADELNHPRYATRSESPVLACCSIAASDRFAARDTVNSESARSIREF
ncbi:MAG: hypothetical protein IOC54_12935 [Methylobacterium sp.]|jgi:hypothetical protein|nr:hypothetical protein [Rhodobacter sp.]MCA3652727.1 hypothetical protein [Methylobacterium sp.]MCZ8269656.1 hypothetical protein [Beijerinckiaceae bacterium]